MKFIGYVYKKGEMVDQNTKQSISWNYYLCYFTKDKSEMKENEFGIGINEYKIPYENVDIILRDNKVSNLTDLLNKDFSRIYCDTKGKPVALIQ